MSIISEREADLVEEFELYDDWMDKYEVIIERGRALEAMAESSRKDELLIKGCQSKVWLDAQLKADKVRYSADSEAIITKGLIALMIEVLSDAPAEEIVSADLSFIKAIGLQEHLSITRSNGLAAMIKQMKVYALALSKA